MNKLENLHTLVQLLKEFDLPVSPILEYAIKEKEEELSKNSFIEDSCNNNLLYNPDSTDYIGISLKEKFQNYLYKTKSPLTAQIYLRNIDKNIRQYINRIVDSDADSIYSYTTIESVQRCLAKLKADDAFMTANQRSHNSLTASLKNYMDFLENNMDLK